MRNSNYHRILRVSALVVALVLVFESGLISKSTAGISSNTYIYVASVIGMSASVQPTELNKLTADLTAREKNLSDREAALREREIAVSINGGTASNNNATYILASILFILLVLIVLNYVLDYLRTREERFAQPV